MLEGQSGRKMGEQSTGGSILVSGCRVRKISFFSSWFGLSDTLDSCVGGVWFGVEELDLVLSRKPASCMYVTG